MSRFPNIEETVSPKPWNYNVGPGEDGVNGERIVVTDKHYNQVANVFPWAHHGEANAKLIAAAPELLKALELCSKALSDIINAADNGEAYSAKELHDSFISDYNQAFEAIAKAKGE